MKQVFHAIIVCVNYRRLSRVLLVVSLFLLMTVNEMIGSGTGIQVAYDVIWDDDDKIIAVGKNSYENNSMISLLKFNFEKPDTK